MASGKLVIHVTVSAKRLLSGIGMSLALALGLLAPTASPAAAVTGTTYVTLYGDGDYVPGYGAWLWRADDVSVGWDVDILRVGVDDGVNSFAMAFAAAPGESLAPGTYTDAQRASFRDDGHPGIDVYGNGRGCNTVSGSFTVHEIAEDLSTVSIDYESHCEGASTASRGEIRIGVDPATVALVPDARTRFFEPRLVNTTGQRPVTVHNLAAEARTITGATVTAGSEDFGVATNGCGEVAAGGSCTIGIAFHPTATGTRTGTLTVADASGGSFEVGLQGTGQTLPVTLTLSSARSTYVTGQTVALTAQLGGGYSNSAVTLWKTEYGGSTTIVTTKQADAGGVVTFAPTIRRKTVYKVTWTDSVTTKQASVTVYARAKAVLTMKGYRTKGTQYAYFTPGNAMRTAVAVAPNKAGRCVEAFAQFYRDGAWRAFAKIDCLQLGSDSKAVATLDYNRAYLGIRFRFRAIYRADGANLEGTSPWAYAQWRR